MYAYYAYVISEPLGISAAAESVFPQKCARHREDSVSHLEGGANDSMEKTNSLLQNTKTFLSSWRDVLYVLYVMLLCAVGVVMVYVPVKNFENAHLAIKMELTLTHLQYDIEYELEETDIMLSLAAASLRDMIARGGSPHEIRQYMKTILSHLQNTHKRKFEISALYGFFEPFGNAYIDPNEEAGHGYPLWEQPWHKAAVEANGQTVVTPPRMNAKTKTRTITYSQRFFDEAGRPLGILCLDMAFDRMRQYVITAGDEKNPSFGGLLDSNLVIIAHQDQTREGTAFVEMGPQFAHIADILRREGSLAAHEYVNYQGELSTGFFTRLKNGWYLCIVKPNEVYSQDTQRLALQLAAMSAVLIAGILALIIHSRIRQKHSAERVQMLLDATPVAASIWNREGKIIDCNLSAVQLFGLSSKQEYIDRFPELSPEFQPDGRRSRERIPEIVKEAYAKGVCRFEWIHQKPNGEPIPADVTTSHIPCKDGDFIASYVTDTREIKAAIAEINARSAKLEETTRWYESILNSIPSAILVQDNEMKWVFINTTAENLVGKKQKDVLGILCSSWGIEICNTEKCAVNCVKQGTNATYFVHNDRSYQVNVSPIKNAADETIGFVEAIQDVTDLEQITKQQAETENESRAKSAFVARISHEIRSPLNVILGIAEAQLSNKTLPSDIEDDIRLIYTSGSLLRGIINDVLDFSKIEAGKIEIMSIAYDTENMLTDVIQQNRYRIGSKPINFKINIDHNVPKVLIGDELHLKEILNNLLSNAFKYTEKGEIAFTVTSAEGTRRPEDDPEHAEHAPVLIEYSVSDTGYGMTEEQLEKVFEAYTRFVTTSQRAIVGTGLGMAITHNLVELMNGKIQVESTPRVGTVFTVRIPQYVSSAEVIGTKTAEAFGKFHFDKKSIMEKLSFERVPMPYGSVLIVDDLETNIYVAERLLEAYELTTDSATSGAAAIEKVKNGKTYDIIFMDHMMPEMDGIETTRNIRALGYTAPIVALTANSITGRAEMFLENGFDDFVSKPINTEQLDQVLLRLIRDKHENAQDGTIRNDAPPPQKIDPRLANVFMREAEKALHALEKIYGKFAEGNGDMKAYTLTAHTLKSALAIVSENDLASLATTLEEAGEAGEPAVILEKTPSFIASLKTVIEKIKSAQQESR